MTGSSCSRVEASPFRSSHASCSPSSKLGEFCTAETISMPQSMPEESERLRQATGSPHAQVAGQRGQQ
jgi:hypothetical protein